MRTFVYIDGLNLYYRALKGTPWKWLDLSTLLTRILQPHHDILRIKYYTARVSGTFGDPTQQQRQRKYISALRKTQPKIEISFGHFLSHKVRMPLARQDTVPRMVEVIKTEEKASDVNLAVHLLNDSWLDVYDCAVVISNDSDLAEAMRLVGHQNGKRIGLITPGKHRPSRKLMEHADFSRRIRDNALRQSLLPDQIPGTNIRKPSCW